jgi:hypothetical protein
MAGKRNGVLQLNDFLETTVMSDALGDEETRRAMPS